MKDWAEKKASGQTCPQCVKQYGMGDNGDIVHMPSVARLLRQEHQRAVRIVKRLRSKSVHVAPWDKVGYRVALDEVLTALERGRWKGGK